MSAFPQYQGGSSVSVFTAQGSNPAVNCKISGKSVHKVYDRSVKGYVYNCAGGISSKIQFPKDEKTGLQLVQPYLVLQIFVPKGQHFSLELRATDTQSTRRKMYLSTSFSELKSNPLHCQIPLSMIMRNTWISLALDVPDLFQSCFRVLNYRSANKELTLTKLVSPVLANKTDNQVRLRNFDLKKPLTSKLEEKELDLLYDPILDCYYDPKTNRYYELK